MPELPDVQIFKEYFDATSLKRGIAKVEICDAAMLQGITCADLSRRLTGRNFIGTRRYGKYLFAGLDNEGFLILHFGMTGFLRSYRNEERASGHIRLLLRFSDNYHLAFDCRRKLGMIGLTDRVEDFVRIKELGPDALDLCGDREAFADRLRGHRGSIKGLLMNQQVLAGIGNVYADEILFQAGIHPKKRSDLDEHSLHQLAGTTCHVLTTAVEKKAGAEGWPKSWLLSRRGKDASCPRCSGKIRRTTVSGRTTFFCPEHQK